MRLAPLLAALLLLSSPAAAQTTSATAAQPSAAQSPLVGTWESIDRQGGMGSILVFAPDNSLAAMVSVIVDARYTRKGNRVQITEDGDRADFAVVVTGNTMVQTMRGKSVTMTRIPGTGADTGIVGKWRHPYEVEGRTLQATTEYTADGVVRMRIPLQTQAGTYSVAGNELTLRLPNAPPETGPFSIDGDVLIVQRPDGPRARMRRAR